MAASKDGGSHFLFYFHSLIPKTSKSILAGGFIFLDKKNQKLNRNDLKFTVGRFSYNEASQITGCEKFLFACFDSTIEIKITRF